MDFDDEMSEDEAPTTENDIPTTTTGDESVSNVKGKGKKKAKAKSRARKSWSDAWHHFTRITVDGQEKVVLDPRYKLGSVEFVLHNEYGVEEGKKLSSELRLDMDALFDDYKSIHQPQTQSGGPGSSGGSNTYNEPSSQVQSSGPLYSVTTMGDMYKRMRRGNEDIRKNEIDVYLKEDPLDGEKDDFDILKWWKLNHMRFPILSLIVRDILAMLISTVASESTFSAGNRVLDPCRSSLTPKIVEGLLCAQDWLRGSNQPKSIEEDLESILQHEEGINSIEASLVNESSQATLQQS